MCGYRRGWALRLLSFKKAFMGYCFVASPAGLVSSAEILKMVWRPWGCVTKPETPPPAVCPKIEFSEELGQLIFSGFAVASRTNKRF